MVATLGLVKNPAYSNRHTLKSLASVLVVKPVARQAGPGYCRLKAVVSCTDGPYPVVLGNIHPPAAATAATQHGLHEPSAAGDRLLLAACTKNDTGAFLCLRCRVSEPLEQKVRGIHRQFAEEYDLDLISLASFVLDDDGRPLSYQTLKALPTASISPFTAQVVCSYDASSSAGLPHWARLKVQAHSPLKAYLREHGLVMISDWALLANSSARRMRECWEQFGAGSLTAARAITLYAAYLKLYPQAKAEHRQRSGRSSGWQPDDRFLRTLRPDQSTTDTRSQLQAMAHAVRLLLSGNWQRHLQPLADEQGTEIEPADPTTLVEVIEEEGDGPANQLALIHAALERAMASVLPDVLAPATSDPQLSCLWQGYGEGLTNTPLAERCGCARGTVSKKLRPELHATTIARQTAAELLRHPAFSSVGGTVEGLERMVDALRNHLLHPEREGDIAPLRRWVHQHLPVS
jgi:hypothetical protein